MQCQILWIPSFLPIFFPAYLGQWLQRRLLRVIRTALVETPCDPVDSPVLRYTSLCESTSGQILQRQIVYHEPFRRIALLLNLRKDTLRLVILAMRALWHLSVALDLLLATHVACLYTQSTANVHLLNCRLSPQHTRAIRLLLGSVWSPTSSAPRIAKSSVNRGEPFVGFMAPKRKEFVDGGCTRPGGG